MLMYFPNHYYICTCLEKIELTFSLVLMKKSTEVYLITDTPNHLVKDIRVSYNGGKLGTIPSTPKNLTLSIDDSN